MNTPARHHTGRLVLLAVLAATCTGLFPGNLAGRELPSGVEPASPAASAASAMATSPDVSSAFFEAIEEQGGACGGPGQRACCFGERATACDAGLREVALGQFPNACVFGAGTCMPVSQPTACGGEGQRACCIGEAATACAGELVERWDDLALDSSIPVSGDATCSNNVIAGSTVPRATSTCVRRATDPPLRIAEPTSGWTATPEPRGILRGYHDMHLHLLGHMAHGAKNLVGAPAPVDANGQFVIGAAPDINDALSPGPRRVRLAARRIVNPGSRQLGL